MSLRKREAAVKSVKHSTMRTLPRDYESLWQRSLFCDELQDFICLMPSCTSSSVATMAESRFCVGTLMKNAIKMRVDQHRHCWAWTEDRDLASSSFLDWAHLWAVYYASVETKSHLPRWLPLHGKRYTCADCRQNGFGKADPQFEDRTYGIWRIVRNDCITVTVPVLKFSL